MLIVIGSIVGTSFAVVVKHLYVFGVLEQTPTVKIAIITCLILIALPLSALGIVFGIKLLKLEADLRGLLKPMVYIYIVSDRKAPFLSFPRRRESRQLIVSPGFPPSRE